MRINKLIISGRANLKSNSPEENYRKCNKTVMRISMLADHGLNGLKD